ncbi:hypothetical protein [Klebsiella variicola]|uniref:hypothetical protein n=1 Tax=Klebsiella variicola TaxID=244366 RepID=UPI00125A80BF|nr:hypothetical protein [Klebsiella variicola]VAU18959.1 Uncharacterised protein [Klebsiella variicola]
MTNNQLTEAELTETLDAATSGYQLTASAEANLRRVFAELQERRKADSEPVGYVSESALLCLSLGQHDVITGRPERNADDERYYDIIPLYRHAQQPVVPDDVLDALQKVARIRLDMNDFDGDRRGIADCLGDAEEALIEAVNRRAAMLAAARQEDINALIPLVSRNEPEVK